MKNFQSVETLLSAWKALHPRSKLGETMNSSDYYEGGIVALTRAIEILNQPSNAQMQADAAKYCAESQRCMGFLTTGESLCGGCKLHR